MVKSGIYEIVNLVNGKRYVGSSVNAERRMKGHCKALVENVHHSRYLQRSWNSHKPENFLFRVIEEVEDISRLIEREQYYIDTLKPEYNSSPTAGSSLGVKWSEEAKRFKASQTKAYFEQNPEARENLREINKGKPSPNKGNSPTKEQREYISKTQREVWSDPEYRQRMSDVHKGYKQTPEHREKKAAALRGRKLSPEHAAIIAAHNTIRNKSPEHRAKMSEFWKGRPKTPEQIAKMAETKRGKPAHNKGKPASDEQKAKQSAAIKRRYEENPELRIRQSEAAKAAHARKCQASELESA